MRDSCGGIRITRTESSGAIARSASLVQNTFDNSFTKKGLTEKTRSVGAPDWKIAEFHLAVNLDSEVTFEHSTLVVFRWRRSMCCEKAFARH